MLRAIDLFAGWGGFTEGAEQAGARVVWAANHWPLAVEAHAANHPRVEHVCQDLRQADWSKLPAYDLLLASPACQGHSQAAQPGRARSACERVRHDALRSTAWAVVECADVTEPRAIIVENVPDFLRWRLYPVWREALVRLGFIVQERTIVASRLGVPQRRARLFVFATRRPIDLGLPATDEPAFGPCVDPDAGGWRPVARASAAVQERIRRSRARLGEHRFLTQHTRDHFGVSLSEPIRTITTKDQWALVDGDAYRPLTIRENARAMGFPDSYRWPAATRRDVITGIGNAVCPPVARRLVEEVSRAA